MGYTRVTHTYTQLLYHFVWSTKDRLPMIPPDQQARLYSYIGGIVRSMKGTCLEIGGMPDHVHLLASVPPRISLADFMRELKSSSTQWCRGTLKQHLDIPFGWQAGYGVFSVSRSRVDAVTKYIQTQEEHHKGKSFREEFLELLELAGIDCDQRYLWK